MGSRTEYHGNRENSHIATHSQNVVPGVYLSCIHVHFTRVDGHDDVTIDILNDMTSNHYVKSNVSRVYTVLILSSENHVSHLCVLLK